MSLKQNLWATAILLIAIALGIMIMIFTDDNSGKVAGILSGVLGIILTWGNIISWIESVKTLFGSDEADHQVANQDGSGNSQYQAGRDIIITPKRSKRKGAGTNGKKKRSAG